MAIPSLVPFTRRLKLIVYATPVFIACYSAAVAQAQTYSVIHDFTGGGDGRGPRAGVTVDFAGNLYGTTSGGGVHQHGAVFRLKNSGSTWSLNTLYSFTGGSDGADPEGRVTLTSNGVLYGTVAQGGITSACARAGCGLVFQLRPPVTFPRSAITPWTETVLYRFAGVPDAGYPQGDLTLDAGGNIYGTSIGGGQNNWGSVYELTHAGGSWSESVLYSALGNSGGALPNGGVVFDHSGNLYGTLQFGGAGNGRVFRLVPSGSGWIPEFIHDFSIAENASEPIGGLLVDGAGNVFGTTFYGSDVAAEGFAFELSPSGDNWSYSNLYGFNFPGDGGSVDKLTSDPAGNLYGTLTTGGAFGGGAVFKLSPSASGWTYASLYDFCPDTQTCSDGFFPMSAVSFDAAGNLYGTTYRGGAHDDGVVWKITP